MSSFSQFTTGVSNIGESCHAIHNGFLYTSGSLTANISKVNLGNGYTISDWAVMTQNGSRVMTNDLNYLYIVYLTKTHRISISTPTDISYNWSTYTGRGEYIGCATHYNGNIYFGTTGTSPSITRINTTTGIWEAYIVPSPVQSITAITNYNGFLYYYVWSNGIYKKQIDTSSNIAGTSLISTSQMGGFDIGTNTGLIVKNNYILLSGFVNGTGCALYGEFDGYINTEAITKASSPNRYNVSDYNGNIYCVSSGSSSVYIAKTPLLLSTERFAPLLAGNTIITDNNTAGTLRIGQYNNFIYGYSTQLFNVDLSTNITTTNISNFLGGGVNPNNISIDSSGNIYIIKSNTLYRYSIQNNSVYTISIGTTTETGDSCIVYPYLYFNTSSGIGRIDIQTMQPSDVSLNWCTAVIGQVSIITDNAGYLYTSKTGINPIYKISINNPQLSPVTEFVTKASDNISNTNTNNAYLTIYDDSIYVLLKQPDNYNIINRYNLTNPTSYYVPYAISKTEYVIDTTYNTLGNATGILEYAQKLYIMNGIDKIITRVALDPPYIPTDITIDTGNTKTVAAGNLQVQIIDLFNIAMKSVYYQYSINNNPYINSGVLYDGRSQYTFFIPFITDISNSINVRAINTTGNSNPSPNLQVLVYQTPIQPSQVTFEFVNSGNVRVTIQETSPIPDYYYLNNVSYNLYAYNKTVGGNNLSGNTSASIYNYSVGVLSNTNATYNNVVSYVNTGLSANTYTMYVVARNAFGNSTLFSGDIDVYTDPAPPLLDQGNTVSATSGNLTIAFTDPSNSIQNGISYYYYIYDSNVEIFYGRQSG